MGQALVIGGGPAGLMAADQLLQRGHAVTLTEAKPSLGRKFLMAGKSGLNLTKMEPPEAFQSAYDRPEIARLVATFGPQQVYDWATALGQDMFTGSTGRLFPRAMKASPLLRAWLARLDQSGPNQSGLDRRTNWRWTGWQDDALRFDTPDGVQTLHPDATILALGGASWARLGSDGAWADLLAQKDVPLRPFAPSNVGLTVPWSPHMTRHFGQPLKNATFRAGPLSNRGEAVVSARGLEGGGLYPLAPALRAGHILQIDLFPDQSTDQIATRLARPRGKQSLSNHLRKTLRLSPVAQALIQEYLRPLPADPLELAQSLKALPVANATLRPLDEAISTVGGVPFEALDEGLMLHALPGMFCAGEMLDWDAPTGGYLLTACLATGRHAGMSAADWLERRG